MSMDALIRAAATATPEQVERAVAVLEGRDDAAERALTVDQLADALQCSRRTIYTLGIRPAFRVGSHPRFYLSQVLAKMAVTA